MPPFLKPSAVRKNNKHTGLCATEDTVQKSMAHYLDLCVLCKVLVVWWHVPNGGWRGKAEAARFKALGVRAGVPDLTLVFSSTDGCPLVAMPEVKREDGVLSVAQKIMVPCLQQNGVPSRAVRTLPELREFMAECCLLWDRGDLLARLPRITQ